MRRGRPREAEARALGAPSAGGFRALEAALEARRHTLEDSNKYLQRVKPSSPHWSSGPARAVPPRRALEAALEARRGAELEQLHHAALVRREARNLRSRRERVKSVFNTSGVRR